MAVVEEHLAAAFEGFTGTLLRPGEPGWEEARSVHNGLIDRRPALIARCRGVADVVAAVNFAREHEAELAVRGGGHNVAGYGTTDGGVLLDLSTMNGIHVDHALRTARAQGGVTWRELNRETQLHGLAVTGGVISSTGIAGLTLGGGLGWMMAKYGLSADNLMSADVVTADGRVLTASADENADLFWGLRGGGGNFGVVTSFEYQLHPVGPIVTGGLVAHPLPAARDGLRFYREFSAGSSDDLEVVAGLVHAPDGSGLKILGFIPCHLGPPPEAQQDLEPLLEYGSPVEVQVGPLPYQVLNTLLDEGYAKGMLNYWKTAFFRELSDEAIDMLVEQFERVPSPLTSMIVEHFHGAVTRVPVDATAVQHRKPGYNLVITSMWTDPAATEENIAWTRQTFAALEPYLEQRRWTNYLDFDDPVRDAFGPNYDRLLELKRKYDPTNLFRLNANIDPAA